MAGRNQKEITVKNVDGKWKWHCTNCDASNSIPLDCKAEELHHNRVVCPKCSCGYIIDGGLNLRCENSDGHFLVTAALDKDGGRWIAPSKERLAELTAIIRDVTINAGAEIVEEHEEHRSIVIRCSPADAMKISKNKMVCAVAQMQQ